MNHNKTVRSLEQKLEQRDKDYNSLYVNFQKLKTEYERQYNRMKEMQTQIDFLSNIIQKAQNHENTDEEDSTEEATPSENESQEEMVIEAHEHTNNQHKRKITSPPLTQPPAKAKTTEKQQSHFPPLPTPKPQNQQHQITNTQTCSQQATHKNKQQHTQKPQQQPDNTQITTQPTTSNKDDTHSTEDTEPKKKLSIPPIVMRDTSKWNEVNNHLRAHAVDYSKARQADDGIKITPTSTEDYRKIIRFFDEEKIPYHTYKLPEEKQLHIVLRGIPITFSIEEIKDELQQKGFHPENIFRMTMQPNRRPIPLVLALIPKSESHIFELTNLLHLSIKVESLKNKTRINQCRNCQKHGHGQSMCKATPKCLKCAANHHTASCTKPRDQPAKCANCGGDHPANYRQCPHHPDIIKQKKTTAEFPPARIQQNLSYAQATQNPTQAINSQLQSTQINQNQQNPDLTSAITNILHFANQFVLLSEQLSKAFAPFLQLNQNNSH